MASVVVTAPKAALEALGNYLKTAMPSLEKVLFEFPHANQLLQYPCVSLIAPNPKYTPLTPYILSQSDTYEPVLNEPQRDIKYIVGMYDMTIQVDMWCRDKTERNNLLEEFFAAMTPSMDIHGVSRQLTDYHGVWCRYAFAEYELTDSEGASQRAEWRAKINVLANTRAVRSKTEYIMETFETNLTTPDTIPLA